MHEKARRATSPDPAAALESALSDLPPGPLLVALSGGLDSSVLLHALAASPQAHRRGVRAVHVDHALQADSRRWADHCVQCAAGVGVPLSLLAIAVPTGEGIGPEAAARRARYDAIAGVLAPGEILVLAHHRDDQAETVLLKLLRGAGPEGLAAMRPLRSFGAGFAWRPLLGLPRAALRDYAVRNGLSWMEDPSNADAAFDRNYLRHVILPPMRTRWPQADASIVQSANWLRNAADFIETEAAQALARIRCSESGAVGVRAWLDLPDALRDPVVRLWLRERDLPEPTRLQIAEIERQLATAGADRSPCVRWAGAELRRYRDRLHAVAPTPLPPAGWERAFDGTALELPAGLGSLQLVCAEAQAHSTRLAPSLRVRFRRGGECLRPAGGAHVRELRKLWQEAGIPPWERERTPLVFDPDGALLAVADRWQSDAALALFESHGGRLQWRRPAAGH